MSEDFTLYRGESGTPHCVGFRCAHRGTQLSTGWVEGDELRCFYHGWKYGANGQCTEQPAEPEPFCSRIRINSYPTQEYLGLIFVYLGEGEPPAFRRYPEFEEEGVLRVNCSYHPYNYFNRIENYGDEVHLSFVHHVGPFTDAGLDGIPEVWAEETDWGFTKFGKRQNGVTRASHFFMPNTNLIKGSPEDGESGWTDHMTWPVPIDDETSWTFNLRLVRVTGDAAKRIEERIARGRAETAVPAWELAEDVLAGTHRIDDVANEFNLVSIQDHVAQHGQGAIADREHEHLGRSDAVLVVLRQLWSREMQALADGRPLKEWSRPERILATTGV
jgi:5,5'-dehydrodivanillate O-demethylase